MTVLRPEPRLWLFLVKMSYNKWSMAGFRTGSPFILSYVPTPRASNRMYILMCRRKCINNSPGSTRTGGLLCTVQVLYCDGP
jgi:hypothetical protein